MHYIYKIKIWGHQPVYDATSLNITPSPYENLGKSQFDENNVNFKSLYLHFQNSVELYRYCRHLRFLLEDNIAII